jgi:hypothetical protein
MCNINTFYSSFSQEKHTYGTNYHTQLKVDEYDTHELYDYDESVYCLQVPEHVFMIRQNNKNVWTGNCSSHG